MKTRESGMQDEEWWQSFFDLEGILIELGLDITCRVVVDMGSGYGTFAIPAAPQIRGTVYAIDFDPQMEAVCQAKAEAAGLKNVICQKRDIVAQETGLPDQSADFAMLFNILHGELPVDLLEEAHRTLIPGGKVGVIRWNYDTTTLRGPSMEIRPRPKQCQDWVQIAGFQLIRPLIPLPPYHYGIAGQKKQDRVTNSDRKVYSEP